MYIYRYTYIYMYIGLVIKAPTSTPDALHDRGWLWLVGSIKL